MIDPSASATKLSGLLDNLSPSDFVTAALQQSGPEFMAAYGDTQLLLIKLDDPTGELAAGLLATMSTHELNRRASLDVLGYHTVVHSDLNSAQPPGGAGATIDEEAVRRRCARTPHFVVPLRKRASETSTYQERISVGRARNKDVVLRHRSVSKFHGWFERNESGELHVADAGSKNGVLANGQPIPARQLTQVSPGDVITFGAVETFVCPPDAFWKAVHS